MLHKSVDQMRGGGEGSERLHHIGHATDQMTNHATDQVTNHSTNHVIKNADFTRACSSFYAKHKLFQKDYDRSQKGFKVGIYVTTNFCHGPALVMSYSVTITVWSCLIMNNLFLFYTSKLIWFY